MRDFFLWWVWYMFDVMARFCNLSWRCHHIQQYACTKCKLVLGSSNLSNKEKRNTMGKCIWKSWWYTICLAHGVVFCSWNSSTNLPKCFRYRLVYYEIFNSGTKSGFPCIESHAMDTVSYEIYSCLYLWLPSKVFGISKAKIHYIELQENSHKN